MLRRLFACLALLTGLATAGAPAQAEVVAALASRVEASANGIAATKCQANTAVSRPLPDRDFAGIEIFQPVGKRPPITRTVELRIDRARE